MRIGFGKAELTPPIGTELAGYGYFLERKAERVDDPLFVRAAAIEGDMGVWLLVSCDCLGLSREIADTVKENVERRFGVSKERVTLVSIHTHTGPAMKYHGGCGNVNEDYVSTVPERILSACETAIADLSPVSSLRFIKNRLEKPCALNRAFAQNPVDDFARLFVIERPGKAALALASYACHPVCRGVSRGVSADYPGQICEKLTAMGYDCMYLNGLCGDINPIIGEKGRDPGLPGRFADTVIAAMQGEGAALPMTVSGGVIEEKLRLQPLSREDISAIADQVNQKETDPPGGGRVAREWEKELLSMNGPLPKEDTFQCHYIVLGGVPILSLPFEGYTLTGILIRQAIGDDRALTLGCQEEMLGYLPTEDDFDRHSYAALDAFFLYRRVPTLRGEAERIGRSVGEKFAARLKEGMKP